MKKTDLIDMHTHTKYSDGELTPDELILKAQKEEIREQQRVEKEIQDAKRKLEKEEAQFNNEMNKLLQYLNKSNNDIERNIYADKIKELEDKINLLEKDKENILQSEQNTRAGFVYIISNIGSFGEGVELVSKWLEDSGHNVETKLYEGCRHEIHNYKDLKCEVEAGMIEFLDKCL